MSAPGAEFWDERAEIPGLHAVLSRRWTPTECRAVDVAEHDLLASHMPAPGTAPVLDLGSGIGRLTAALAGRASKVVSLDLSMAMLRRGRQSRAAPVQANAASLPFAAGVFGTVLTSGVLQHLEADAVFETALREIARVLAPCGSAVMVEGLSEPGAASHSATTFPRPLSAYAVALGTTLRLHQESEFIRVSDRYAVLVWEKAGA